jgi:two-component system, NtrC family, sensor kinase
MTSLNDTTPIEQAIQDFAGLAALVCDTPFAALTLRGVDLVWWGSGARIAGHAWPIHNPFNAYAIQCTDLFEVTDVPQDERFAAITPVVDGHSVFAYAGAALRAADGSVIGTLAVLDVAPHRLSGRQRAALLLLARQGAAQLALREQLMVAQARVESAPVAIYQTDARGQITYANPEYRRFLSLGPTESLDNWVNVVHADDKSRMEANWGTFCENPGPVAFEYRTASREGVSRVLTEQVVAAVGTAGFIGTITDITERVEARAHLQRAETLSHHTFEQAPIGIVYADRDGRVLRANQAFCNMLGFTANEIEATSIAKLTHDADIANNKTEFERLWAGDINVIDGETRYVCTDGRAVWVRVTTALVRDASGAPSCAVQFLRDISARKDLAAALTQNQRLLQAVITDLPVAIRACDVEGRVFLHNSAAAELFAIEASDDARSGAQTRIPSPVEFLLPDGKTPVPSQERPLARALRGETVTNVEFIIARAGAETRTTLHSARRLTGQNGECLGAVAVTQDVTQKKQLERELAQAQKLESIGHLAAGVAHEINTPVQFVSDNVQFVRTSLPDIAAVIHAYRHLQQAVQSAGDVATAASLAAEAEKSADLDYVMMNASPAIESSIEGLARIAVIVRSMKEFAHPDQAEKKYADLNQAIRSTLVVAHNEYKYVAEIDTEFGELPAVQCYLGEINQVILNLLVNASHAIADVVKDTGSRGKLTVRTRLDGDAVEISIGDTGCGIPEAAREKIFDPFFTTKEVGKGTGQGLAIARSVIVNKHGGTLRFETECGKGTTFFIRLPIDALSATAVTKQAAA